MTQEERLIVSAYTGILMTDFNKFHKYCEEIMNRPIWAHEFADKHFNEKLKEKVKNNFMKLCGNT
jgi:hypothetical protein